MVGRRGEKMDQIVDEIHFGGYSVVELWGRISEGVLVLRESVRKWAMRAITPRRIVVFLVEHVTVCLVETNIPGEVWKCSNVFVL